MDHKRIEWLFLIVFLLIDIYLGVEILRSPVSLSNSSTNATNTNIKMEMRADGIELPNKISRTPSFGYYLAAKKNDYLNDKISSLTQVNTNYSKNDSVLHASPKEMVEVGGNSRAILQKLQDFKDDPRNVPYGKNYRYEPSMSGDDSYTFVQSSEYGDIYDNAGQLTINIQDGKISNYTMTYMGSVNPVREQQSTISAWHAIRAMYTDRELANNSRVVKIKLGYSKLTEVRGNTILLPTWLVWVESKNTKNITLKRVNAFSGQMIQTNTEYNVEK